MIRAAVVPGKFTEDPVSVPSSGSGFRSDRLGQYGDQSKGSIAPVGKVEMGTIHTTTKYKPETIACDLCTPLYKVY